MLLEHETSKYGRLLPVRRQKSESSLSSSFQFACISLPLSLSLSPSDNSSLTRTAEASTIPSSAGKRTRLEPAAGSEGAKKRAGRGRKMRGRVFFCSGDGDGDGDIGVVETKLSKMSLIKIAAR